VLIGGMPAATAGDACACTGPPDVIVAGSSGVLIGGKPAARIGDATAHGGVIVGGCGSVLIGERRGRVLFGKQGLYDDDEGARIILLKAQKREALLQAIQDSIRLLENRLKLLAVDDPDTVLLFQKWFGGSYEESKRTIVDRITNAIDVAMTLSEDNFDVIEDLRKRRLFYGLVHSNDESHTIYIGFQFWSAGRPGHSSMAGIIIHELSHFQDVGNTEDHGYDEDCVGMAKDEPEKALFNADSFQFFIEGK
jgi:hypothetical protein